MAAGPLRQPHCLADELARWIEQARKENGGERLICAPKKVQTGTLACPCRSVLGKCAHRASPKLPVGIIIKKKKLAKKVSELLKNALIMLSPDKPSGTHEMSAEIQIIREIFWFLASSVR